MNLSDIEAGLEKGLDFVKTWAPIASTLGGPAAAAIGTAIGQVAGLAEQVIPAIENDVTIIGSGDLTKIKALQAQLQQENASLAAQIAAS